MSDACPKSSLDNSARAEPNDGTRDVASGSAIPRAARRRRERTASARVSGDDYHRAVAIIAANCGREARALLQSGHPFLTPAVVLSLARTAPERQAFELAEVRAGRRPFSAKTDVFDTTGYGEIGSRLARASGGINKFARGVELLTGVIESEDRDALAGAVAELLRDCGTLWAEVRRAYATRPADCPDTAVGFRWRASRDWSELDTPSARSTLGLLGAPAAFVRKCVRDLRRIPELPQARRFWPTRAQTHSLGVKLFEMSRQLLRARERIAGTHVGTAARIVTHTKPDADALVAAWLAERYLLSGRRVDVVFVPYGHNWASGPVADCVVDVGGLCDPALGLFDHRPPARADRHETCATALVWMHLAESGRDVGALGPLVDAVRAGDSPKWRGPSAAYAASRRDGVHALVVGLRERAAGDREVWAAVRSWLNEHYPPTAHEWRSAACGST